MSRCQIGYYAAYRWLRPSSPESPFKKRKSAFAVYDALLCWSNISDQAQPLPLCGHILKKGEVICTEDELILELNKMFGIKIGGSQIHRDLQFLKKLGFIKKLNDSAKTKKIASIYSVENPGKFLVENEQPKILKSNNDRITIEQRSNNDRITKDVEITEENIGPRITIEQRSNNDRITIEPLLKNKKKKEKIKEDLIPIPLVSGEPEIESATPLEVSSDSNLPVTSFEEIQTPAFIDVVEIVDPQEATLDFNVTDLVVISPQEIEVLTPKTKTLAMRKAPTAIQKFAMEVNGVLKSMTEMYAQRYEGTILLVAAPERSMIKSLIQNLGAFKVLSLFTAYLSMRDSLFLQNHHDIKTFNFNKQKVEVYLTTGKSFQQEALSEQRRHEAKKEIKKREDDEQIQRILYNGRVHDAK